MRWTRVPARAGDVRTRHSFLLLPAKIGTEVRWFERAKWQERAVVAHDIDGEIIVWEPECWLGDAPAVSPEAPHA